MRIRQVKPAFWSDAKLASIPHDARLFYIGLWMLADDDGWLRWDVAEIGKDLYGFENRGTRERRIEKMSDAIRAMPGSEKLSIFACGHAELPRLAVHQHLAGTTRRVSSIHDEHLRCPATPRDSPPPVAGDYQDPDEPFTANSDPSPRLPATPRDSPPRIGKVSEGIGNGSSRAGLRGRAQETDGFKETDEEKRRRLDAILQDPDRSAAVKEAALSELSRVH